MAYHILHIYYIPVQLLIRQGFPGSFDASSWHPHRGPPALMGGQRISNLTLSTSRPADRGQVTSHTRHQLFIRKQLK